MIAGAYGSLFTGIGGLDLALEAVGFGPPAWQVENDSFCRSILSKRWPGTTRFADVRDAGAHNLAPVRIIAGGPPCQPVSVAGLGEAQSDERWIWPEFARIVGELRPEYVFVENVSGLLTAGHGSAFGEVLGSLASLGFAAEWGCFRASDVGAPHRRERVFLLAYSDHERRAARQERRESEERRRAVDDSQSRDVAHADRARLRPEEEREGCTGVRTARGSGADVADAGRVLQQRGQPKRVRGSAVPPVTLAGGEGLADADQPARRPPQPAVGRVSDGISRRLDPPRWPAGRFEDQHPWEPPRTEHGIPFHPARLKALGNAVVWPQAALAFVTLFERLHSTR